MITATNHPGTKHPDPLAESLLHKRPFRSLPLQCNGQKMLTGLQNSTQKVTSPIQQLTNRLEILRILSFYRSPELRQGFLNKHPRLSPYREVTSSKTRTHLHGSHA